MPHILKHCICQLGSDLYYTVSRGNQIQRNEGAEINSPYVFCKNTGYTKIDYSVYTFLRWFKMPFHDLVHIHTPPLYPTSHPHPHPHPTKDRIQILDYIFLNTYLCFFEWGQGIL